MAKTLPRSEFQMWHGNSDTLVKQGKADLFGRTSLKGEIPDFLYDVTSSVGDTFVLYPKQTEDFLDRKMTPPGFKWPWNN